MKRVPKFIKNRYFIAGAFTLVYIFFMHNTDVATLISRKKRVTRIEQEIERKKAGIEDLKISLNELNDIRLLEKYAREKHLFKKDDEDIFIFSWE